MSQQRKKKKIPPKKSDDLKITKSVIDHYSTVARKTLQILELDPALFDQFTKKQKMVMMQLQFSTPKVLAHSGHDVPKRYLRTIQREMYDFTKRTYVGDPSIGLLYYDYLSIGLTFNTFFTRKKNIPAGLDQTDAYFLIADRLKQKDDELNQFMNTYGNYVRYVTLFLSKLNFRVYGFTWEYNLTNNCRNLEQHLMITSAEPERIYFTYQQKSRPAYRLIMGSYLSDNPILVSLPYNEVFKSSNKTHFLKVYVQTHALKRLQERLDTRLSFYRYSALTQSILNCEMVTNQLGQLLFACRDLSEHLLGYFPFTIEGDHLYILSFLPLVSPKVPEGKLLCETLNTNKEDLIFLGMDKLSFYKNTDFDKVTILKEALIKSNMWHLTEIPFEENDTGEHAATNVAMLNRFFQHNVSDPGKDKVLEEIAEMIEQ